jgi:predicted solute-binding protein
MELLLRFRYTERLQQVSCEEDVELRIVEHYFTRIISYKLSP